MNDDQYLDTYTADTLRLLAARGTSLYSGAATGAGVQTLGPLVSSARPWWIDFPRDARFFDKSGAIVTPALGTSLATVFSFTSRPGWKGVIDEISQNYTGPGLVQGSGDLLWTIRRSNAVEVEYNALTFEIGTINNPSKTRILFDENELIEFLVSVSATASVPIAGTFIICRMKGWFVPKALTP